MQAFEGAIAGLQHRLKLPARDGGLLGRSFAAFDRGAPGAAEQSPYVSSRAVDGPATRVDHGGWRA